MAVHFPLPQVHKWSCERSCNDIPTKDKNIILLSGDHIVSARCQRAIDSRTGEAVWNSDDSKGRTLLTSCTTVTNGGGSLAGEGIVDSWDCINGSLIPDEILNRSSEDKAQGNINYTSLLSVFHTHAHRNRLDRQGGNLPFDIDITIFKETKMLINYEGCVNTLREECTAFYKEFGKDGRNQTSPSRYRSCVFS